MAIMDFPADPVVGQRFTNSLGIVYVWDGFAWLLGLADTPGRFTTVGDLISQVRVLLQDTDTNGGYRYSTPSLVMNLNQGLIEMFRIRPDIFLPSFIIPAIDPDNLDAAFPVEMQWLPSLVYYTVGLTQMRDDEGTQDARASGFLAKFTSTLVTLA